MNLELKSKIKLSMQEYLVSNGWPNSLTPEHIIAQHLPSLWKKLEAEGLLATAIENGFGYRQFVEAAIEAKKRIEMLGVFMNNWSFK